MVIIWLKKKLLNLNLDHRKIAINISIGNRNFALVPIYQLLKQQSFQDEVYIIIVNYDVMQALEHV